MVVPQGAAERRPGVGGARRHPEALDVRVLEDLGIGDAIERHAAGHAQVARRVLLQQRAHHMQDDLLRHRLERKGHIAMPVGERLVGRARRPERGNELALEGPQLSEGIIAEIGHVDGIAAIRRRADDVAETLDEGVLAECRERHHLAFVAETGKTQILGHERIDEPGRVHDVGRPDALQPVAAAHIRAARAFVAVAVHDHNQRLLERGDKEHGGMRAVVRNIDDRRNLHIAEEPAHIALQIMVEQNDLVLLRGVRAGHRQAQAQRKAAQKNRSKRLAQQPHIPRRRQDVDVVPWQARSRPSRRRARAWEISWSS